LVKRLQTPLDWLGGNVVKFRTFVYKDAAKKVWRKPETIDILVKNLQQFAHLQLKVIR
jgi:hypothetical protein